MSRDYEEYCGPAVVAAVLGISKSGAADVLQAAAMVKGRRTRRATTYADEVAMAVRSEWKPIPKSSRITFGEWIYRNSNFTGIVLASRHFIFIEDGRIQEDNGRTPWQGYVCGTIPTDKAPKC